MITVIGDLLAPAIGVALSPIPIVAIVLMVMSRNAAATSIAFAIGWISAVTIVTIVTVLLAGAIGSGDDGPSPGVAWLQIGLGALLLILAIRQWRARSDDSTPAWMTAIDEFSAPRALGLGVLLAAVNPKNLLLCVSAGLIIGSAELPAGSVTVAIIVFVVIATASVTVPVAGYRLAADRLRAPLNSLQTWLAANNHAVMAIVLLLLAASVLGKGLGAL